MLCGVVCGQPLLGFPTDRPHDPSASTTVTIPTSLSTGETAPSTTELPTSTVTKPDSTTTSTTAATVTDTPSVGNDATPILAVYVIIPLAIAGLLVFAWMLKRGTLKREETPSEAPILMDDLTCFTIATSDGSVASWVDGCPSEVSDVTEWEFEHVAESVV